MVVVVVETVTAAKVAGATWTVGAGETFGTGRDVVGGGFVVIVDQLLGEVHLCRTSARKSLATGTVVVGLGRGTAPSPRPGSGGGSCKINTTNATTEPSIAPTERAAGFVIALLRSHPNVRSAYLRWAGSSPGLCALGAARRP